MEWEGELVWTRNTTELVLGGVVGMVVVGVVVVGVVVVGVVVVENGGLLVSLNFDKNRLILVFC